MVIFMNLLFILPPDPGAGVKRLCELLFAGNETAANPHSITVICREDTLAGEYKNCEIVSIPVTKSEPPSNRILSALRVKMGGMPLRCDYEAGIRRAMKGRDFDRIILENCPEYARAAARAARMDVILHAHDRFFGKDHPGWKSAVPYFEKILFVSDFLRDGAAACGIPAERLVVLHNCVDTAAFDAALYTDIREEKRAQYGLGDDDLLAVFVGLLTPEKGVLELTKALGQSEYADSKLKLLLVGSAHYGENVRDDYRDQLEAAAPEGRVVFIGSVKPTSTARFLARADFAVVPSVYDEPAGLPVLEALSSGLPTIVSDAGGIPEYAAGDAVTVVPRGLGYVTSLAKAIDNTCAALRDPDKRRALSEAARAQAMKFDAATYYDAFMDAIG